jgi:hypothetical protein
VGSHIENLRSPQARIASKWAEMIHPIMLRAESMYAGHVLAPTLVAAHTKRTSLSEDAQRARRMMPYSGND